MRIRIAVPDAHVSPAVLNAALETTTRANEDMLATGDAAPITEAIKHGAVKWKPEPFRDGEHFDLADTVHKRGWGDCDDLAPALAAELRHKGIDPDARAIVKKSGPKRWHAVTELSNGRILDPSAMAGMYEYKKRHGDSFVNGPGDYGIVGTSVVGMLTDGALLGLKPWRDGYASRCDLPVDGDAPVSVVGVATSHDALTALCGAVNSACLVGAASEMVSPEDIARAIAVRSLFQGAHPEDVAKMLESQLSGAEVGSLFGSIFKGLKKIASPVVSLAKKAAPFVPIPGATLMANAADSLLKGGGGGGGKHAAAHAAAPHPAGPYGVPGLAAMTAPPATVHTPAGSTGPIIIKF